MLKAYCLSSFCGIIRDEKKRIRRVLWTLLIICKLYDLCSIRRSNCYFRRYSETQEEKLWNRIFIPFLFFLFFLYWIVWSFILKYEFLSKLYTHLLTASHLWFCKREENHFLSLTLFMLLQFTGNRRFNEREAGDRAHGFVFISEFYTSHT